jgi:hypothetical protein
MEIIGQLPRSHQ